MHSSLGRVVQSVIYVQPALLIAVGNLEIQRRRYRNLAVGAAASCCRKIPDLLRPSYTTPRAGRLHHGAVGAANSCCLSGSTNFISPRSGAAALALRSSE